MKRTTIRLALVAATVGFLLAAVVALWPAPAQAGPAAAPVRDRAPARRAANSAGLFSSPDSAPLTSAPPRGQAHYRECFAGLLRGQSTGNIDAALARLAEEVPETEIVATLESLTAEELRSEFGRWLFEHWAESAPRLATLWAIQHAASIRKELLGTAVDGWAARDLSATLGWFDGLPEDATKDLLRARLAAIAASERPVAALRLALELPDAARSRDSLLRNAIAGWTRADPRAVAAWVQRRPADELRDRMIGAFVSTWAYKDGPAALEFALTAVPPGKAQTLAVGTIVQNNTATAGEWLARLSDEALCNATVPAFVCLWTVRDAAAAGQWLNALPPGAERDAGAAAYARTLGGSRPDVALAWARSIDDPDLREQCLHGLRALFTPRDGLPLGGAAGDSS